jgi:hypothetical protein
MSIAKACYVMCDTCNSPGPTVVEGAKEARLAAKGRGFTRIDGHDLCLRCARKHHLRRMRNL